ncbi:MAG TPA: hypothetical protein VHM20_04795 [Gammaproteobacteria bacterium]|jgi:hypothetical protein|nr:hypothetical protein [Gammaproteobacteria bacterium]
MIKKLLALSCLLTFTNTFAGIQIIGIEFYPTFHVIKGSAPSNPQYTYAIKYSDSSPIKKIPLENNNLKVQVYYYGNPMGFDIVSTDYDGNFTYDKYKDTKAVDLEILAIDDQDKYKARCSGSMNARAAHELSVTCKPIS